MSAHVENLNRAARLLRRIGDAGGVSEFEGVTLTEIVGDVLMAAHLVRTSELGDALVYRCNPMLAELAEVVDLHDFSKKVGA